MEANSILQTEKILENWGESLQLFLPKFLLAILVVVLFYFIARLVKKWSFRFYLKVLKSQDSHVARIISVIIYFLTFLAGVFLALEIMGLESVLSKLIAGAGIVGIVAGFAFKDIASNAFAGFLVNAQRPFKEGDWVEINEVFGTVKNIGAITTSIKTVYGQVVYVPNQLIYNNTFTNYSFYQRRMVALKTGVSYGDDLERVKNIALSEIAKMSQVIAKNNIQFYFTSIGGSAYNFELRFWIKFEQQTDYLSAMDEAIVRIKKRFEQENISIAYPVTTLDFGVKGGVNIFDEELNIKS